MRAMTVEQSRILDALLVRPSADLIELLRQLYCAETETEVETIGIRVQLHLNRHVNQERAHGQYR